MRVSSGLHHLPDRPNLHDQFGVLDRGCRSSGDGRRRPEGDRGIVGAPRGRHLAAGFLVGGSHVERQRLGGIEATVVMALAAEMAGSWSSKTYAKEAGSVIRDLKAEAGTLRTSTYAEVLAGDVVGD